MKKFNLSEIKEIEIIGLRWFEKTNGNTYHSVEVIINSKDSFYEGLTYGYGTAYEQTAKKVFIDRILNKKASNMLNDTNSSVYSFFQVDRNIKVNSHHTDVKNKKDL